MSAARVTVACCCRNGSATLAAALDSALRQTHANLEVLLIDDMSTDDSFDIMSDYAARDDRVRPIKLAARHGLAGAQNVAVEHSESEFLAFIDADDLWHAEKIVKQLQAMDSPDTAVVGCYSAVLDDEGALRGWRLGGSAARSRSGLLKGDPISGGSVALLRVAAVRSAGGFDDSLVRRPDWDMWLRLSRLHRFGFVPRVLVGYRRGTGGLSSQYEQMVDEGRRILHKVAETNAALVGDSLNVALAADLAGIAGLAAMDGSYDVSREMYRSAAEMSRGSVLSLQRLYVRAALSLGASGRGVLLDRVGRLMSPIRVGARAGEPFDVG